jgi:hypothetical protein
MTKRQRDKETGDWRQETGRQDDCVVIPATCNLRPVLWE